MIDLDENDGDDYDDKNEHNSDLGESGWGNRRWEPLEERPTC